jgi:hypothetical protein
MYGVSSPLAGAPAAPRPVPGALARPRPLCGVSQASARRCLRRAVSPKVVPRLYSPAQAHHAGTRLARAPRNRGRLARGARRLPVRVFPGCIRVDNRHHSAVLAARQSEAQLRRTREHDRGSGSGRRRLARRRSPSSSHPHQTSARSAVLHERARAMREAPTLHRFSAHEPSRCSTVPSPRMTNTLRPPAAPSTCTS